MVRRKSHLKGGFTYFLHLTKGPIPADIVLEFADGILKLSNLFILLGHVVLKLQQVEEDNQVAVIFL